MDDYSFLIFLGIWFFLQIVVFPKLGIPSCLGGSCQVAPKKVKVKSSKSE